MGNSKSRHQRRELALADKYRDPKRLINCFVIGDDDSDKAALIMRYLSNDPPTDPARPSVPVYTGRVCFTMIARQRLYNVMLHNIPGIFDENQAAYWLYHTPDLDVIMLCFSLLE